MSSFWGCHVNSCSFLNWNTSSTGGIKITWEFFHNFPWTRKYIHNHPHRWKRSNHKGPRHTSCASPSPIMSTWLLILSCSLDQSRYLSNGKPQTQPKSINETSGVRVIWSMKHVRSLLYLYGGVKHLHRRHGKISGSWNHSRNVEPCWVRHTSSQTRLIFISCASPSPIISTWLLIMYLTALINPDIYQIHN